MVMRSGRTRGCLTAGARIDICPEPGRGVAAATEHVGRVPAGGSCPGTTTDAGEAVGGRPEPSADLLRQLDDDPLRAADVAEPIAVFVALHLANELRAAGSQASDDGVDVVDCDSDTTAPATASLGCRSAGGNAPPIGLKRPAMSCSAQWGHSLVREPMEDAQ